MVFKFLRDSEAFLQLASLRDDEAFFKDSSLEMDAWFGLGIDKVNIL